MSEKRFFTKVNKNGRNVIIDKECHIELIDLTLACEVLNRLDLKLKTYNEQISEQQSTITALKEENEKLQKENNDYEKQFRIINEKLDEYIKTADTYRIPISSLKYGDELGYFNGVYQYMKKLKKDIGGIGYD